jgi:predicted nucleic acid-binding protein
MSFLLDTNLISELRRGAKGNPRVRAWRSASAVDLFYLSVMTTGEIRKGIEALKGKDPKTAMFYERWLSAVEVEFGVRILPVTADIADVWGRFMAKASISPIDGLIAATAAHHGHTVATRNTRDFQKCGVDFVNPFEYED